MTEHLARTARTADELDVVASAHAHALRTNEGLPFAEQATRTNRNCARCFDTYGMLLAQSGRLEDARRALNRAVTLLADRPSTTVLTHRKQIADALVRKTD